MANDKNHKYIKKKEKKLTFLTTKAYIIKMSLRGRQSREMQSDFMETSPSV